MIEFKMFCHVFVFFCIAQRWTVFSDGHKTDDRIIPTLLKQRTGESINSSHIVRVTQPCVKKDACSCARSDGTGINLHFLVKGNNPRFTAKGGLNQIIKWNPCIGFKVGITEEVAVASGFSAETLLPAGLQSTAKFSMSKDNPAIDYTFGDTTSRIILLCDDSQKPTLTYASNDNQVTAAYNGPCNSSKDNSISIGSIIVITFFVILIVYIVAGTLVNVYVKKAAGRERFPNYSFWSGLPSLIQDGCTFTFCHLRRRRLEYGEI